MTAAAAGRWRAWLELARLSNAPTVVSNVLAGSALASASAAGAPQASILPAPTVALVAIGCVAMYAAGMVLNDVVDVHIDRAERPSRPIPSGRVSRGAAAAAAVVLIVLGGVIVALGGRLAGSSPRAGWGAVALAGAIVLYNLVHQRSIASVAIMGLCRGLVYVIAAAAVWPADLDVRAAALAPALLLGVYVSVFSLSARGEVGSAASGAARVKSWAPLPAAVGVVAAAWAAHNGHLLIAIAASLAVAAVVALACAAADRRPPQMRRAVLGWIAAICLIDCAVCACLGRPVLAAGCVFCFAVTVLGHRRIPGT